MKIFLINLLQIKNIFYEKGQRAVLNAPTIVSNHVYVPVALIMFLHRMKVLAKSLEVQVVVKKV